MKDFFGRAPFVFIGALGLISFTRGLIEWQKDIAVSIDAYRAASGAVWNTLLGWMALSVPQLLADYLTMGVIVLGALVRATIVEGRIDATSGIAVFQRNWFLVPVIIIAWPISVIATMSTLFSAKDEDLQSAHRSGMVYAETFVWAFLAIALNYALVFWRA